MSAREEVIDAQDVPARSDQRVAKMRSDEAGASGYEVPSGRVIYGHASWCRRCRMSSAGAKVRVVVGHRRKAVARVLAKLCVVFDRERLVLFVSVKKMTSLA